MFFSKNKFEKKDWHLCLLHRVRTRRPLFITSLHLLTVKVLAGLPNQRAMWREHWGVPTYVIKFLTSLAKLVGLPRVRKIKFQLLYNVLICQWSIKVSCTCLKRPDIYNSLKSMGRASTFAKLTYINKSSSPPFVLWANLINCDGVGSLLWGWGQNRCHILDSILTVVILEGEHW